jgi:hypothetical protein
MFASIYAYKLQVLPQYRIAHNQFEVTTLEKLDEDNEFLRKIMFSDEGTFHISGKITYASGDQNTIMLQWITLETPKVNVWCGLVHSLLIVLPSPAFNFFAEATVASSNYEDMLENLVYSQLQELQCALFFLQDGAPPHWSLKRVHFLRFISQTDGLAVLNPCLGQPHHRKSHPTIFFYEDT